jgi:signal transduction histidine kinase/ActR/RegA family two-component response regulator
MAVVFFDANGIPEMKAKLRFLLGQHNSILRYAFAFATVVLSLFLREYLRFWLKQDAPLLVFLMSVVVSASYGGVRPGIFATIMGGLLGTYYFIEPFHSFMIHDVADQIRVGLYIIEGFAFSYAIGVTKKALANETALREKLENTVVELTDAKKAEEEAIHTKSMFLANLTHEIRTPLGVIIGNADLLGEPKISEAERTQRIQSLQRNCRFLSELIDRYLDMSKAESGMLEAELKRIPTRALFQSIFEMFEHKAKAKCLKFEILSREDLPEAIVTDPIRLQQILMNLVGNAIKFTSRGHVLIEVLSEEQSAKLIFRVEDTGVGLSPEQKLRLFQPFSQGDGTTFRKFGGTGLGLYLSRNLAHLLGGDVVLESSELGKGSCFRASIQTNLHARKYFEESSTRASAKADLRGLKVLVVDDTEDVYEIISEFLTLMGAQADVATSGREAIEKVTSDKFDIVLMDVQMPFMDGYETTKFIRANGFTVPIVALTAHASEEARSRAKESGCTAYMTKPVNFDKLGQVIFTETGRRGK